MLRMFRRIPFAMAAGASAVALAFDPYLPSVSSLVEFNTNNSGYYAVDQAGNTFTNNGVIVGHAIDGNYGYFNGASCLSTPASTDFNFGSDNFTIEGWFFANSTGATQRVIQSYNTNVNGCSFGVLLNGGVLSGFLSPNDVADAAGNKGIVSVANTGVVAGRWTHFAFVRNGNSFQLYVNGVATNAPITSSVSHQAQDYPVYIGARWLAGTGPIEYFNGFIDSIRVTKGVARYTNTFTPAQLKFDNTDQHWNSVTMAVNFETGFVDLKSHAITNSNVVRMIPGKFDNDVLYFKGSASSFATISSTSGTAFASTDNFTVEYCVNMPVVPTSGYVVPIANAGSGGFSMTITPTAITVGRSLVGADHSFMVAWSANTWYHITVVRKNGILSVFINGVCVGQGVNTTVYAQNTVTIGIDGNYSSYPYTGFMSGFRITKGIARYEVNQPMATAFTADDNTLSLLHFNSDAGLVDSATNGPTWTNVGSATLSSTQKLFGASSLSIPATNCGIKSSGFNWAIGTGDYTIEFSWYNTSASDSYVFDTGLYGTGQRAFLANSGGGSTMWFADAYGVTGGASIYFPKPAMNAWHHFAAVRKNGVVVIYVDGVAVANGSSNVSLTWTGMSFGGYSASLAYAFIGYYDEFRVSNIARYGVTVPSSSLTANSSTLLLLKGEGSDSSTNIVDELDATVNRSAATISTAEKKWGTGSISIPGAGVIQIVNKTLGNGDFTIEGFFKRQSGGYLFDVGSPRLALFVEGNKLCAYTTGYTAMTDIPTPINGSWHHFALVRKDGVLTIYVDGNPGSSGICTSNFTNATWNIGNDYTGGQPFNGYLDDFRISSVAMYSPNFNGINSVPSEPYKDYRVADYYWDQTTFLVQGDSLTEARGITLTNDGVAVSSTERLFDKNTLYFNGSSSFRVSNVDSNFNAGTGNFTLEFHVKANSPQNNKMLCGFRSVGGDGLHVTTGGINSTIGTVRVATNAGNVCVSTSRIDNGVWNHVAIVRRNGIIYIFVNGVLEASANNTTVLTPSAGRPRFGASDYTLDSTSDFFMGYLAGIRFTKQAARYPASFSVPLAAYPNYGTTGPVYDVYAKYTKFQATLENLTDHYGASLTLSGSGNFTNTNSRNGKKVLNVPGTAGGIYISNSEAKLGVGDFTLEFNIYNTVSYGTWAGYLDSRVSGESASMPIISNTGAGSNIAFTDTVTRLSAAIPMNKWVHVAFVRIGTTLYLYVDGVLAATAANITNNYSTGFSRIGTTYNNYTMNGFMSDLRITHAARYFGNFIKPDYVLPF